jgi:predicted SprT family Zn-dependent metalloprotease
MTKRAATQRRAVYDDDLHTRMEAAMARTRRFIMSTQAVRATVQSQDGTPFTPRCANCQQSGQTHESPPTSEQHYICAHCHKRWIVDGVLPVTAPFVDPTASAHRR